MIDKQNIKKYLKDVAKNGNIAPLQDLTPTPSCAADQKEIYYAE
jgi:hypothetical protein